MEFLLLEIIWNFAWKELDYIAALNVISVQFIIVCLEHEWIYY